MNQSNELQSINNNYLTCPNFNHSLPSLAIMSNPNSDEQPQIVLPASSAACTQLSDANKAFDDVVFDILKVGPDEIAGQLTLIDLPLFKAIEPDELISCKWMSREKLIKAPNIVQFTRRFNQTTFWCQKEILNCKRIEKRAKMLTHFIKICKRLNELHSFNSLMAIVVALKSASIYRLKKTWSHISKRDQATFDRLADLMFDTSDNKRKMRDMHMNCRLPCIPFLGLFLTDLIHIDIAHPHNSFDNPQRRNQMNNICRLVSEYQQSNYQDLSSLTCSCEIDADSCAASCQCGLHHGKAGAGGLINSDGTIYINDITYVQNYLHSFLYIEELQKFKEDENYRDSLDLEPDADPAGPVGAASPAKQPAEPKLVNPLDDSLLAQHSDTLVLDLNDLSKDEQRKILNNVKLTEPPTSLLRELLKQRHQSSVSSKPSLRHKFSCYSSSTADLDADECDEASWDDESCGPELTPVKSSERTGRNLSAALGLDHVDQAGAGAQIVVFESPVKRKCMIKNFRKPKFSQWKSYWLQLVAGNLLIYYPAKSSLMFSKEARRSSVTGGGDAQLISSQMQTRKMFYQKNPCKMHPIANWMVVDLCADSGNSANSGNSGNSGNSSGGDVRRGQELKYDIQLNDLHNGNMYKYRLESGCLAKEWLEQFKVASTYHERQKPDNLIRFD